MLKAALSVLQADLSRINPQALAAATTNLDKAAVRLAAAIKSYQEWEVQQPKHPAQTAINEIRHVSDGDSGKGGDRT